jgi:hypothetical protein
MSFPTRCCRPADRQSSGQLTGKKVTQPPMNFTPVTGHTREDVSEWERGERKASLVDGYTHAGRRSAEVPVPDISLRVDCNCLMTPLRRVSAVSRGIS